MKKALFAYVILGLFALCVFVGWWSALSPMRWYEAAQTDDLRTIHVGGQVIHVSIADTRAMRALGLGGRAGLAYNEGMLFVFPRDDRYSFWMKDMLFPVDILWLAADGRVVYMVQRVDPNTYPKTFTPDATARYVLELPSGYAGKHGVAIGDLVQL